MGNPAVPATGTSPSLSAEKLPAVVGGAGPSAGGIPSPGKPGGAVAGIGRRVKEQFQNAVRHGIFHKPIGPSKDGRRIPLRVAGFPESSLPSSSNTAPDATAALADERRNTAYISNIIRTSRYTLWDFVPKQIWFQFTRLSNFYFLCVGIPQTIPGISTTGNFTTILPLIFFVLLTIVKEGYDDYKRHRLDTVENARSATVLRSSTRSGDAKRSTASRSLLEWRGRQGGGQKGAVQASEPAGEGLEWRSVQWRDVEVGDVVRLSRDEDVPADLVLLHADSDEHVAFVETMALDGETNLKSKLVPTDLQGFDTISELIRTNAEFVLEDPNPDLYRFDGRLTVRGNTSPLTLNEVLYRGSTLRNTPFALGLVINTGEECKIRMNANRHPKAKKPALEKVTNRIVLSLVAYVLALTAGCSIGYLLWQRSTESISWYLSGAAVAVQDIVVGYAIHFNNLIPLSLFVTLEITKLFQMMMLNGDIEMYDEASDTPAKCNTNTILENLGQVGYIFSDKTGTLTENVMKLRKLAIAGTSWLHEMDMRTAEEAGTSPLATTAGGEQQLATAASPPHSPLEQKPSLHRLNTPRTSLAYRRSITIPEEVELAVLSEVDPSRLSTSSDAPLTPAPTSSRRNSSQWKSTGRPDHVQPELTTEDLLNYIRARPNTAFAKATVDYLLALALCHTCLPETRDGEIDYQAASPDELALVRAAQEMGFVVIHRSAQSITLRITEDDSERVYQIMDVVEFSSKRKRMSIVVRCPDGRLLLICKGADSVVLPRLKLAHLAMQKASEVRQSADLEREILRRSEQLDPLSPLGGRASLTLQRRSIGAGPSETAEPSRPTAMHRSRSSEAAARIRRSLDFIRPSLKIRTTSFDGLKPKPAPMSPFVYSVHGPSAEAVPLSSPPARFSPTDDEKFAFLEDPSITDPSAVFTKCFKHIDDFASEGLRTLIYSQRHLGEEEYATWRESYHAATTSLVDRQERIEAVGESIERELELVGASAIEDKLQKGVPETIDKLRRANIRIWMLTGDKRETAINIAHSARICKPHSDVYVLDAEKGDVRGQIEEVLEELREQQQEVSEKQGSSNNHHTVVVVDGHTLGQVELSPAVSALFFDVAAQVDSVICCRASPAQKALLVRTIRRLGDSRRCSLKNIGSSSKPHRGLTLSIGDGGNDLAMLAEAHVGVGISGREGLQAARVADYSVAQFRFLARLLLVHGRWNYARTARFVLATFWKEMFFYTGTITFQYFVGYTGTSLYEMWSLTALNVLFTSLCVIIPALWEQDLSPDTLLAVPELYVFGQGGQGLNVGRYIAWMLAAVAEGLFVFFACWAGVGVFGLGNRDQGLYALGNLVFSVAMMWTNWKLLIIDTHHKNIMILGSFLITTAGWWAWQGFLSGIYSPSPNPYAVRRGIEEGFGQDLGWWVCLVVVLAGLVVAETAYKAVKRQLVVTSVWQKVFGSLGGGGGRGGPEHLDLELWQELEQDPDVRGKLRRMCWEGCNDDDESAQRRDDENVIRVENVV